jgi:anti-sigma regulatory factor (Ser/Thr protein kinase)
MVTRSAEVRLNSTPQASRRARRFVTGTLAGWQVVAVTIDTVVLLTSELVTNALRYGRGAVGVLIEQRRRIVRVSVRDDRPDLPRQVAVAADSERGRGLWLVEALAKRWGAERLPDDGKQVWFEVEVDTSSRRDEQDTRASLPP